MGSARGFSAEGQIIRCTGAALFACAVAIFPPAARADPFEQLPAETIQRISGAAQAAVRARVAGASGPAFDLAADRAIGYRLGAGAVVIVPDRTLLGSAPVAGQALVPVAVLVLRDMSVGDFQKMVALDEGAPLSIPGGAQNLRLFFVGLRAGPSGRTLEIYGTGKEPVIRMPARVIRRAQETPIALRVTTERFMELTLTIAGSVTASVRLGPVGPADAIPQPARPEGNR